MMNQIQFGNLTFHMKLRRHERSELLNEYARTLEKFNQLEKTIDLLRDDLRQAKIELVQQDMELIKNEVRLCHTTN